MSGAASLTISAIALARFAIEQIERGNTELTREQLDAGWAKLAARRAETKELKQAAKEVGGYT